MVVHMTPVSNWAAHHRQSVTRWCVFCNLWRPVICGGVMPGDPEIIKKQKTVSTTGAHWVQDFFYEKVVFVLNTGQFYHRVRFNLICDVAVFFMW